MQKTTTRHFCLLAMCGLLALGALSLTGCSGRSVQPSPELESVAWWEEGTVVDTWAEPLDEEARFVLSREILLDTAEVALGTPYRSGGTSLGSGFDCSGFVQWAYKSLGIDLPRTAREQARFGEPVSRDELREGDVVAFRHPRRGYHTGIYVGDGKFIHSPRQRSSVKIVSLDNSYFKPIFIGARRLPVPDNQMLVEAMTRLEEYKAFKATKPQVSASKRTKPKASASR